MKEALLPLIYSLRRLGGFGLFIVGILDSSFLFLPLGNDLLILSLAASNPSRLAWYALMATLGSTTGALLIDVISRKGGEQGLSRVLPKKRIDYVKSRVRKHAAWAVAAATLLPPPFPFTPFIAAAAALQFPRWRLLAIVLSARMLRFSAIGVIGIVFGNRILKLADNPVFQYTLIGLVVVCIAGSALSVYGWIKRSRHHDHVAPA
jgi:membrane protein YqaA with SNARE-associated domain